MVKHRDAGIIEYIKECCEEIICDTKDINFNTFINNHLLVNSVTYRILQIGEEAKHFSPEFLKEYNAVSWKDIKGMRDWVAHGYHTLLLEDIYGAATEDVPIVFEYCNKILLEFKNKNK